jgi:hypothetical protein
MMLVVTFGTLEGPEMALLVLAEHHEGRQKTLLILDERQEAEQKTLAQSAERQEGQASTLFMEAQHHSWSEKALPGASERLFMGAEMLFVLDGRRLVLDAWHTYGFQGNATPTSDEI